MIALTRNSDDFFAHEEFEYFLSKSFLKSSKIKAFLRKTSDQLQVISRIFLLKKFSGKLLELLLFLIILFQKTPNQ